jgi:hypothetical protein
MSPREGREPESAEGNAVEVGDEQGNDYSSARFRV